MNTLFILLVVYQLKHFIADYPLQTPYMLRKFAPNARDWVPALSVHCAVHSAFTLCITMYFVTPEQAALAALFDFVCHFIMDRIKASPNLLGRYEALTKHEMKNILSYLPILGKEGVMEKWGRRLKSNTYFWWSLGLDQFVHHICDLAIVYYVVLKAGININFVGGI